MSSGEGFRSLRFLYQLWEHGHLEARPLLRSPLKFHQDVTSWCFQRLRSESLAYSWHLQMDPLCKTPGRVEVAGLGYPGETKGASIPHSNHQPPAQGHAGVKGTVPFHVISEKNFFFPSKAFLPPFCMPELSLHFQRIFSP